MSRGSCIRISGLTLTGQSTGSVWALSRRTRCGGFSRWYAIMSLLLFRRRRSSPRRVYVLDNLGWKTTICFVGIFANRVLTAWNISAQVSPPGEEPTPSDADGHHGYDQGVTDLLLRPAKFDISLIGLQWHSRGVSKVSACVLYLG